MKWLVPAVIFMLQIYDSLMAEPTDWKKMAMENLQENLYPKLNKKIAKNVILFIGDGMSITTVTAARIYKGQKLGNPGEETVLEFEKFKHTALSKTYAADAQIPDSGSTATAILCGEKTNFLTVGLNQFAVRDNCSSSKGKELKSILDHFYEDGRSTGIVTNTRLTHATPAAAYAHAPYRYWEGDVDLDENSEDCKDIAYQLIYENDIQVAMGGGRRYFLPNTTDDPETGEVDDDQRQDGRDLTKIWQDNQNSKGRSYSYVWNKLQFDAIDPTTTDSVLGLFSRSHMDYEVFRDSGSDGQPSLKEMTSKAIKILQKNDKGFFLLVESGRIDHSHHSNKAKGALEETIQLEAAIKEALSLVNQEETLIIVTADHSHVFTMAGYTHRGNDILGLANPSFTEDGMPYTTVSYINGPGAEINSPRRDPTNDDFHDNDYRQPSFVPILSGTHAGEDVSIYAEGPMAYLVDGIQEQNYLAYVMQYAACVGEYKGKCPRPEDHCAVVNKQPQKKVRRTSNSIMMNSLMMRTAEDIMSANGPFKDSDFDSKW